MKNIPAKISAGILSIVFLYTSLNKLSEPNTGIWAMFQPPILASIMHVVYILMPWLEITVTLLLATTRFRLLGLTFSLFLTIGFSVYLIYIRLNNEYLPCECGGGIDRLDWNVHILLDVFLIAISFIGHYSQKKYLRRCHDNIETLFKSIISN